MLTTRSTPWIAWAWITLGLTVAAGGAAVLGRIFAPTFVLDLVSGWPIAVLALLVGSAVLPIGGRRPRLRAILPLLLLSWLALTLTLHIVGWDQLPSRAADLAGPMTSPEDAALDIELVGELDLRIAAGPLYSVKLADAGGDSGAPVAIEQPGADGVRVLLRSMVESGWYQASGWRVVLSGEPSWSIHIVADTLRVDLTGSTLSELTMAGNGTIRLPRTADQVFVEITGTVILQIPAGQAAIASGVTQVPSTWTAEDEAWTSPSGEGGYVIAGEGSVQIVEVP